MIDNGPQEIDEDHNLVLKKAAGNGNENEG